MKLYFLVYFISVLLTLVHDASTAAVEDRVVIYNESDSVIIVTADNFVETVHKKKYALLLHFYLSTCNHCKHFAPTFKALAKEILPWKKYVRPAVIDCAEEDLHLICVTYGIKPGNFPSVRYLRENYDHLDIHDHIGDNLHINSTSSVEKLKQEVTAMMQLEQEQGHLKTAPSLAIVTYDFLDEVLKDVPYNVEYVFLVFEEDATNQHYPSVASSEVILDLDGIDHIKIKRALSSSVLAETAGFTKFPAVLAVTTRPNKLRVVHLPPIDSTEQNLLVALIRFLPTFQDGLEHSDEYYDFVYYRDLESTVHHLIHTDMVENLSGESFQAVISILDVLVSWFPFRVNLKEFVMDFRRHLNQSSTWNATDLHDLVERLENDHDPVYTNPDIKDDDNDYKRCKGSSPETRGYNCGRWTLFHTLVVNAAKGPAKEAPKVLAAMFGYAKYLFGCSDCANHFMQMAIENRIFDVKGNDEAVLWLWRIHNLANKAIPSDDPKFPHVQYPSKSQCPNCKTSDWNEPEVLKYLQRIYGDPKDILT